MPGRQLASRHTDRYRAQSVNVSQIATPQVPGACLLSPHPRSGRRARRVALQVACNRTTVPCSPAGISFPTPAAFAQNLTEIRMVAAWTPLPHSAIINPGYTRLCLQLGRNRQRQTVMGQIHRD
jgi:hypothetical protein